MTKKINPTPFLKVLNLKERIYLVPPPPRSKLWGIRERCGIKIIFLTIFVVGIFLANASILQAANNPFLESIGISGGLVPTGCTGETVTVGGENPSCGLDQILQMIVNFSKIILALSGAGALLMFMYGGVLWIIAAGNQERIQKGKSAMAAAAIGLIIILSAWLIIHATICALTGGDVGCEGKIFGETPWYQGPQAPGTPPEWMRGEGLEG